MNRLPLSALTSSVIEALPHNTKLEFHTSSRTRKFVQAWTIDRNTNVERPIKVYPHATHLLGWFDMEYVTPAIEWMGREDYAECPPVMEVRVYLPGEWN